MILHSGAVLNQSSAHNLIDVCFCVDSAAANNGHSHNLNHLLRILTLTLEGMPRDLRPVRDKLISLHSPFQGHRLTRVTFSSTDTTGAVAAHIFGARFSEALCRVRAGADNARTTRQHARVVRFVLLQGTHPPHPPLHSLANTC